MMYKVYYIVLLMLSFSCFGEDNIILQQGKVSVTFDDVDGYVETIPNDKQEGFFSSIKRIDKTLTSILNIKSIVSYANANDLLDINAIKKQVDLKMIEYNNQEQEFSLLINKKEYYRKYLTMQQSYKYFQLKLKSNIDRNALEEMAKEMYMINKDSYKSDETRNFNFVAIRYEETNKDESILLLNSIREDVKQTGSFKETISNFKRKNDTLEVSKIFSNFSRNDKYYEFSNFVFSPKKSGLIDEVLEIKPKLYLVNIIKINNEYTIAFEKVKESIIDGIVNTKYERDFQNILLSITKDKVIVNEENVLKLQTRYSK